jgi:hypothetical protein
MITLVICGVIAPVVAIGISELQRVLEIRDYRAHLND